MGGKRSIAMRHHHLLCYGRSANGTNVWDFDAADCKIIACIRVNTSSPIVYTTIAVRPLTQRSRARGEFGIWRFNDAAWRVERGCFDERHLRVLPELDLLLIGAPERVSETMARLIV